MLRFMVQACGYIVAVATFLASARAGEAPLPPATGVAPKAVLTTDPLDANRGQKLIFQEDFEKGVNLQTDEAASGWHKSYQSQHVSVEDDPAKVHGGTRCLRIDIPDAKGEDAGGYYSLYLPPPFYDTVIISYYIKYADDFAEGGKGSMHCGEVVINSKKGAPGEWFATANFKPDGTNFAKVWPETQNGWAKTTPPGHVLACWRLPNMEYNWYWTGKVPTRGNWHRVVFRIGLNEVGKDNGYLDLWYDGDFLGHFYGQHIGLPGLRMRTVDDLVVRAFYAGAYIHSNSQKNTIWLDDIKIVGESPLLCVAPAELKAARTPDGVGLTWQASAGATAYNVYRSDSRKEGVSAPFVKLSVEPVKEAAYVDTSGAKNKAYYYLVTAVNAPGESGFSLEASAKPAATEK